MSQLEAEALDVARVGAMFRARGGNGIAKRRGRRHSSRVNNDSTAIILAVLERAPQWVRHDLGAKEPAIRARAEETLAAMIASALAGQADA